MPIINIPENKTLKAKNTDPATLKRTMGVDELDEGLERLLRKVEEEGATLYVWFNPYAWQIGGSRLLCGGFDKEVQLDRYYFAAESI